MRTQGQKVKTVVDNLTIERASTEITIECSKYDDTDIVNTDESSICLKSLSPYSWQKGSKETTPREVNSWIDKSRVTILTFLAKNGQQVWKNIVCDRGLTRGLKEIKKLYINKNSEKIRLLDNRQLHMTTERGYVTRPVFQALLQLLNQHLIRND